MRKLLVGIVLVGVLLVGFVGCGEEEAEPEEVIEELDSAISHEKGEEDQVEVQEPIDYERVADYLRSDLDHLHNGTTPTGLGNLLDQNKLDEWCRRDKDVKSIDYELDALYSHINNILYDYYRGNALAELMESGYQGDAVAEAIRIAEERVAKEEAEADDMYDEIAEMIDDLREQAEE